MATPNPPKIYTTQVPNGTPVRERPFRSDYPPSVTSSPATMRPAASFNNPNPNHPSHIMNNAPPASAVPNNQLLTVEALLEAQAGSLDPQRAALDAAVNERNSLSAQNTQLWKLIEKQRSGYNHVIKELERLRGERDLYRNRLQQAGENTDALLRAHRAKERGESKDSLRSTSSNSQLKSSESSGSASSGKGTQVDPRSQMLRAYSDDPRMSHLSPSSVHGAMTALIATRAHQLSPSRSFDPTQSPTPNARMTPERKGSQGTINAPRSDSPVLVNPAHIWHVRTAAGGQAAIYTMSGAVLFVSQSFAEVAALLRSPDRR